MNSHLLYFLRREVAMLSKIVMTLLAFSSAALAQQQQQCQLECTLVQRVIWDSRAGAGEVHEAHGQSGDGC